jgi:hypothetical protein
MGPRKKPCRETVMAETVKEGMSQKRSSKIAARGR